MDPDNLNSPVADAPATDPAVVTPEPAAVPAVAPETPSEPAAPASLDEALAKVAEKHAEEPASDDAVKARDEKGRFAAKEATPAVTPPVEAEKTDAPAAADPASVPAFVPAEIREHFAKAPDEVKVWAAKREQQFARFVSEAGKAKAESKPFHEVATYYGDVFQRHEVDPITGIANLLNAQAALDRDPAAYIRQMITDYNIDPVDLVTSEITPEQQRANAAETELENFRRRDRIAAGHQHQLDQRAAADSKAAIVNEFNRFVSSKDQALYAEIENDFHLEVRAIEANAPPGTPPSAIFEEAFRRAERVNPAAYARQIATERLQEAARIKAEAAEKAKVAKAAIAANSINVRGAPSSPGSHSTLDAALAAVVQRHQMNGA